MGRKRKISVGITGIALAVLFALSGANPANAVVSAGSGGSGGGGAGGDSPGPWVQMNVDHYLRMKPLADQMNGGVWGGIDHSVCTNPNAQRWAKLNAGGYPVYSQNTAWNVGEIPEPLQSAARGSWVNVVCGYTNVLTASEWRYEVRQGTASTKQLREDGVHTLTASVVPQPVQDSEGKWVADPVGEQNLHAQPAVLTRTNYGRVWDEYRKATQEAGATSKDLVSQFAQKLKKAKEQDATADRGSIQLDEANQAGLAEGGILNVHESGVKQSASVDTKTTPFEVWRCAWEHYSQSGWQRAGIGCSKVTGTINPDALPRGGFRADTTAKWKDSAQRKAYKPTKPGATRWETYASTIRASQQTQQRLGFWQILSAHCNKSGLAQLVKAGKGEIFALDSGDSSQLISGLLRTKNSGANPKIIFGSGDASQPQAIRATSKVAFFDKECPLECTPDRNGPGASNANGARNNAHGDFRTEGDEDALWGAISHDGINRNSFELFRDNTEKVLRPDVWYPLNSDGVAYKGEAPKTTLITRWAGGTPSLGEEFSAYADTNEGKTLIFDGKTRSQRIQRNFDSAEQWHSATAGQFVGLIDSVTVKASWASQKDRPQRLQFAWEYSPSVSSRVPSVIGFKGDGDRVKIDGYSTRTSNVDGRCWAEFGTKDQETRSLAQSELRLRTGSDGLGQWAVDPSRSSESRDLELFFVRGTRE